MSNLFHLIMEADGDLVEPFDAGAAADAVESEAEPQEAQPDDTPPAGGNDESLPPFDDSGDEGGDESYDSYDDENQDGDSKPEEQKLSDKANNVLNQTLYQKMITRNQEIEDTLTNLQTVSPALPYDIVKANEISVNRLKAALAKGQSYTLEKFVESKYGENLLFYQKLDALYVLLLNEINSNLKKVKLS